MSPLNHTQGPCIARSICPSSTNCLLYSNIYTRRVLAGEFQIVCPWLVRELSRLNLWDDNTKNRIIADRGSIQGILGIPDRVRSIFKTAWEISQRTIIDFAADRGAFICQSQSLNIYLGAPTANQLTSMHFYGWKRGLKTGMYYLRSKPAAQPIPFTLEHSLVSHARKSSAQSDTTDASEDVSSSVCTVEDRDACLACSA